MAFWKTINGDNTNNWSIKADHAEIKADGNKSNDDWFVSRPFALDAAKAYKRLKQNFRCMDFSKSVKFAA